MSIVVLVEGLWSEGLRQLVLNKVSAVAVSGLGERTGGREVRRLKGGSTFLARACAFFAKKAVTDIVLALPNLCTRSTFLTLTTWNTAPTAVRASRGILATFYPTC